MPQWDPAAYLQFADERSRPFFDLTARIAAADPSHVVDLGCGPGQLTAGLASRWPRASVIGLDSSAEMIESAQAHHNERVRFEVADAREWRPQAPVDVIVSNATLQWIPDHLDLLPTWVDDLTPGGWLAFQVPGNFDEPSHVLLHGLAEDPRFADATAGRPRPSAHDAATYVEFLADLGCDVDAWETIYLHVLPGTDPVFRWISGTGARPVLQALAPGQRAEFEAEYKQQLREAYPAGTAGTILPFRRVFVVARKASA